MARCNARIHADDVACHIALGIRSPLLPGGKENGRRDGMDGERSAAVPRDRLQVVSALVGALKQALMAAQAREQRVAAPDANVNVPKEMESVTPC